MRGAGLVWAEGSNPTMVRADYYDDDQVNALLERAYGLRAKAGTLPKGPKTLADQRRDKGEDDAQVLAVLIDVFEAFGQAAKADDRTRPSTGCQARSSSTRSRPPVSTSPPRSSVPWSCARPTRRRPRRSGRAAA
jgi:hypothetical protein